MVLKTNPQKIVALNVIANGSSEAVSSNGGMRTLLVSGVFGGATVKVELNYTGIGWVSGGSVITLTAAGAANFTVNINVNYRVTITGASGSTNVSYALVD